jgi:VWFA-related protein
MIEKRKHTEAPKLLTTGTAYSALFLSLLLLAPLAFGQSTPGSPGSPAPEASKAVPAEVPGISTTVDEVTLDLMIKDKHHKPVLTATPSDFTVTDENVPVKLNGFHRVADSETNGHLVTLVFDHFDGPTSRNVQKLTAKILKMIPQNGYSFSVLDLPGRLRLIQGFTSDRNAVGTAVQVITSVSPKATGPLVLTATGIAVKAGNDPADEDRAKVAALAEKELISITRTGATLAGTHVDVKVRAQDQALLAALSDSQLIRQDQHALPSLAGLLALVKAQQKSPERKALIYFTQNRQLDSAAKEMVHTIAGAANRSGVNIYIVDMNALDVGGQYQIDNALASGATNFNPAPQAVAGSGGMATTQPSLQASGYGGPTSSMGIATDWTRQDPHQFSEVKTGPMADLAKDTGGAYIDAQDSPGKPLHQMLQDMTTYYQATYVPPIKEYDGSFRTIAVKPLRTGLDVKTKTGYFAVAPGGEGGIRIFEAPLLKILEQFELPTDVKFQAAVLKFGELPNGNTSTVAIEVPLASLETKKDTHTGLFTAHVSIVAQIKDEKGTVVEHFGEDISRRGALESFETDKSAAITFERHFMSIPGKYVMEAAVMDQFGQKAGAQRIHFEIPPSEITPSLSDMVLVRNIGSFHEEDDSQEPLRYEKGKITPNLLGVLPENTKSVSMFFILHPDTNAKEQPVLELEVMHNGVPGHRTPMPLPIRNGVDAEAVQYLANFKAAAMAPGAYEVKATITQGGKTAEKALFFSVPGSATASAANGTAGADLKLQTEATDPHAGSQLTITSITDPVPPPTAEEIASLIADARKRAVSYVDTLPNFLCVEVTDRSIDTTGTGRWKHRDNIAELLRFRDKNESRTTIEVNGLPSNVDRDSMKGQFSSGQFGGVLRAAFEPSAKAEFKWLETDALGSGTVQVFSYQVAKENSMFGVVGSNGLEIKPAYHGMVFIDNATRSVRRITLATDGLPKDFSTQSSSLAVDYDYIVINNHDYLMPIAAEFRQKQFKKMETLNTIEFRDYRRFTSSVKITGFTPLEK